MIKQQQGGKFLSKIKGILRIGKKKTIKKYESNKKLPEKIIKYNLKPIQQKNNLILNNNIFTKNEKLSHIIVVNTIYELLDIDKVMLKYNNGEITPLKNVVFITSPLKIFWAIKFFEICEPDFSDSTLCTKDDITKWLTNCVNYIMKYTDNITIVKQDLIKFIGCIYYTDFNKTIFKRGKEENNNNIVDKYKLIENIKKLSDDNIEIETDLYAENTISIDNLYLQLKNTLYFNTEGNIINYLDQTKINKFNENLKNIAERTLLGKPCKEILININPFNLSLENQLIQTKQSCDRRTNNVVKEAEGSYKSKKYQEKTLQQKLQSHKGKSKIISEFITCLLNINEEFDSKRCYLPLNLKGAQITKDDIGYIVILILQKILDINFSNKDYKVVLTKYFERLKIVYQYKPNFKLVNKRGYNIIHLLIGIPDSSILEYTLKNTNAIEIINNKNNQGYTPLHLALIKNSINHVKVLLDSNASIDVKDNRGNNAIQLAVQIINLNLDILKLLIDFHNKHSMIIINNFNNDGLAALHLLVNNAGFNSDQYYNDENKSYFMNMLKILLKAKNIDVNIQTENERISPLLLSIMHYAKTSTYVLIYGEYVQVSKPISTVLKYMINYLIKNSNALLTTEAKDGNAPVVAIHETFVLNSKGDKVPLFTDVEKRLYTGKTEFKDDNSSFKSAKSSLSNKISSNKNNSEYSTNTNSDDYNPLKTFKQIGKVAKQFTKKTMKGIIYTGKKIRNVARQTVKNIRNEVSDIKYILTEEELRREIVVKPLYKYVDTTKSGVTTVCTRLVETYGELRSKFTSLLSKCKESIFYTEQQRFNIITKALDLENIDNNNFYKLAYMLIMNAPITVGQSLYKIVRNKYLITDLISLKNNISNFEYLANFILKNVLKKMNKTQLTTKTNINANILNMDILKQKQLHYSRNNRCLYYYKINNEEILNNIIKIVLSLNIENLTGVYDLDIYNFKNTLTTKLGGYLKNISDFLVIGDILFETREDKLFQKFGMKLLTNPELSDMEILIELLLAILVDDIEKPDSVIKAINDILEILRLIYNVFVIKKLNLNSETLTWINLNYKGIQIIKDLIKILEQDTTILTALQSAVNKMINDSVEFVFILNKMKDMFDFFQKKTEKGLQLIAIDIQCYIIFIIKNLLNEYSFINFGILETLLNDIENKKQCKLNKSKLERSNKQIGGAITIAAIAGTSTLISFYGNIKPYLKKIIEKIKNNIKSKYEYFHKTHQVTTDTKTMFKDNINWSNYGKYINLNTNIKKITVYDIINSDKDYFYLSLFLSTMFVKGNDTYKLDQSDKGKLLKLFNPLYAAVYNQLCEDPETIEKTILINKPPTKIQKIWEEQSYFGKFVYGFKNLFNKIDPESYRLYTDLNLLEDDDKPIKLSQEDQKKFSIKFTENPDQQVIFFLMKLISGIGLKRICNSIKDGNLNFSMVSLGKIDKVISDYINFDTTSINFFVLIQNMFGKKDIINKSKILSISRKGFVSQVMRFNLKYKFETFFTEYNEQIEIYNERIKRNLKNDADKNLLNILLKFKLLKSYDENYILSNPEQKNINVVTKLENCHKINKDELKKFTDDEFIKLQKDALDQSKYGPLIIKYKEKLEHWITIWENDNIKANNMECVLLEDKQQLLFYPYVVNSQLLEDLFDFKITENGYIFCDETKGIIL